MEQFTLNPRETKSLALKPNPTLAVGANLPYGQSRYGSEWNEESQSGASILQYWRIICRHKRTILLAAAAGLVLGFLVGIPIKPTYRARTSLEVLSFNDEFMNAKETNPVSSGNSADTSAEENQAKLLQSRSLLDAVARKLGSHGIANASTLDIAPTGWRRWLHLPAPVPLTTRDQLVNAAADSLKVQVTLHTHIVEATVESSDRHLATDFANTLASEFIQQSMEARWSSTERTGQWLKREIEGARTRLLAAENKLQAYARESGLIFSDDNSNVATEKLQDMQQVLLAATADRIAKQSRYELVKASPPEALPDLLTDDPSLREISSKMNDLRREIAVLTASVYTPKYSKVTEAQAELSVLQAAFERNRADTLKRIAGNYEESLRKENLLADAYTTQVREVTGQSEKTIQYNILKRDVESNRQLYDNMLQQMKQATIAAAVHVSNVRVVDKADLPSRPISPDFRINAALGFLAGGLFTVFAVIVRDQTDRSFRQPEDIKLWTDLPVLGTIPSADVALKMEGNRRRNILSPSSDIVPLQRTTTLTADAFRSTLASILFLSKTNGAKVLVFTSASVADGKTTATTNLAIAAAETGKRVLVVDADLRRPRIHEVFDLDNTRGLSDVLLEKLPDDRLPDCIQSTAIPGLDVLTSGSATDSAPHLLYSANLSQLFRGAQKHYDLVLIDTPPMLQMPDARLVGSLADAVVLIVRAAQSDRAMLIAAQQRFLEDRTPLLGAILNGWDPTRDLSDYYREYQRYRTAAGAR